MPIITVATSKGGAGKTTIARLLLGHAAQSGKRVAALDSDRNQSLQDWAQHIAKVPVHVQAEQDETRIVPAIEALNDEYDFVVTDTAGQGGQATLFAIGCADLVLVPSQLSAADVIEAIKTMKLVASASQMLGRKILARVVLTGYRPRTDVAAHVEAQLTEAKLPLLRTRLHDLVAFKEMSFTGVVPQTLSAGTQAANFFEEVMELLDESAPALKQAS